MHRTMLKSKIHRATITGCDLHYVGSITIDSELLEAADILEHEQVHVLDIDNGARFAHPPPPTPGPLPMTLPLLMEKKRLGDPIVMVTAYDYPSARAAEAAGVDLVLVGDSGAMTVLGYPSTVPVTLDELLVLARAVRRGLRTPFLVGDLPFGSYEISDEQAVATAVRFVKEAGCDAVKLEGGGPTSVARAQAIARAGIPVMGHVGLTPQTSTALGGYKAQGRDAAAPARRPTARSSSSTTCWGSARGSARASSSATPTSRTR